jgi:hypothetical protein
MTDNGYRIRNTGDNMHYNDPLYGTAEITEPVLLALLQSDALRRLGQVMQHGITGLIGLTTRSVGWTIRWGPCCWWRRLGGRPAGANCGAAP